MRFPTAVLCLSAVSILAITSAGAQAAKPAPKAPAKSSAKSDKVIQAEKAAPIRFVTATEGNVSRYRVRERLLNKELDNDAIGVSNGVTGSILLDATGKLVPDESKFTVNLLPLKSDQDRRDNFVQRRLLETATYPTSVLALTEVRGLPNPVPKTGETTFQLVGNLTVKGVTKPTIWDVKAKLDGDKLTGSAVTGFTFADFSITKPKVPIVLSVSDSIHLEYDFALIRQPPR